VAAFCPNCGKGYEGSPTFCPNCGKPLSSNAQPVQPPQPTQVTQPPAGKKSNTGRNVAIVVIVVLLIIVAAYALSGPVGLGSPQSVSLSGTVHTGYGTHPTSIEFTSDTGTVTYGNVNVVNQDTESYSAQLANGHTYSALVLWSGALGSSGSCNAGSFYVNQAAGSNSMTENLSC
jgi:hypothetical protein